MSKYHFEVMSFLEVESEDGKSKRTSRFSLDMSENLNERAYKDKNNNPTVDGCVAIRETLVSAIAGNIHYAHQKGLIDSAVHLRDVIHSLEQLFIVNGTLGESERTEDGKFIDRDHEC